MSTVRGVRINAPMDERYDEVLTPRTIELITALHRTFDERRWELLEQRAHRVARLADGGPCLAFALTELEWLRRRTSLSRHPLGPIAQVHRS